MLKGVEAWRILGTKRFCDLAVQRFSIYSDSAIQAIQQKTLILPYD